MTTDFTDWIGREICRHRYRIETLIGRGGMGVVFRAYDKTLKTPVAVKAVKLADPHLMQRFKREARSAKTDHIRVLDRDTRGIDDSEHSRLRLSRGGCHASCLVTARERDVSPATDLDIGSVEAIP